MTANYLGCQLNDEVATEEQRGKGNRGDCFLHPVKIFSVLPFARLQAPW